MHIRTPMSNVVFLPLDMAKAEISPFCKRYKTEFCTYTCCKWLLFSQPCIHIEFMGQGSGDFTVLWIYQRCFFQ